MYEKVLNGIKKLREKASFEKNQHETDFMTEINVQEFCTRML